MKHVLILIIAACLLFTSEISAADYDILWSFQTGADIYATPAIHDGVVYVGSLDTYFYAIDANSGEEIWKYKTDHPVQSTAAVFDNGVCFESGNRLYALDFEGELVWQFQLYTGPVTNQYDSWDFHHSSPNIVNNVAYIGTENGWILGVHVLTGDTAFICQTTGKETIRVKPVIDDNRLFVGDWDGVMYAYNLDNKEMIWSYDTKDDNTYTWTNAILTPIVIYNNTIHFAGRSCYAYSLDLDDGELNWKFNEPNLWIVGGTAFSDGMIYYGSSNQHLVYALNIDTGESMWETLLDHRMWNCPLVIDDHLYLGAGSIYKLDKVSGEVVDSLYFSPDSVHSPVMTLSFNGNSWDDGPAGLANFHSSAVQDNDKLIIGCDNGKIYAFHIDVVIPSDINTIKSRIPDKSELQQNYPNPFNPATWINFTLKERGKVEIKIYDSLGQVIKTLVQTGMQAGAHSLKWDGTDSRGIPVASGLYFCQLQTNDYTSTRKMIVLR